MKRELTEEEKRLINKNLPGLVDDYGYQQYLNNHADLMLREGLYQNYMHKRREFEAKKKESSRELHTLKLTIEALNRQLTEGVEVKEKPKQEKKSKKDAPIRQKEEE